MPIYIFGYHGGRLSEKPEATLELNLIYWSGLVHHPKKPVLFAANCGTRIPPCERHTGMACFMPSRSRARPEDLESATPTARRRLLLCLSFTVARLNEEETARAAEASRNGS